MFMFKYTKNYDDEQTGSEYLNRSLCHATEKKDFFLTKSEFEGRYKNCKRIKNLLVPFCNTLAVLRD